MIGFYILCRWEATEGTIVIEQHQMLNTSVESSCHIISPITQFKVTFNIHKPLFNVHLWGEVYSSYADIQESFRM